MGAACKYSLQRGKRQCRESIIVNCTQNRII
nr:MAG TPA: hypothetical protein [Caudoviricetes sp.]